VPVAGLREQKKAQTRAVIAAAAADLFARDGYAVVTMAQVATAAGVSDQTLYNYFPTKESLVFDQSELFERTLTSAVLDRADGVDLIDAYAYWLSAFILGDSARRAMTHPGGMPRLVATSDPLRRMLLDVAHGVAGRLAERLHEGEALSAPTAGALADAMLAIMVRTTEAIGAARDAPALAEITERAAAAVDAIRPLLSPSSWSRPAPRG
jgi:AcrR family transcriptional regulator